MDSNDDILPGLDTGNIKTKKMSKPLPSASRTDSKEKKVENSSSESSDESDLSDSEFICSLCDKKFSGPVPYEQHLKSGKHKKAIRQQKKSNKLLDKIKVAEEPSGDEEENLLPIKKPYAICNLCDKEFTDPNSHYRHLISKSHKRKEVEASILEKVAEDGQINAQKLKELYKNKICPKEKTSEDFVGDTAESIRMNTEDDSFEGSNVFHCEDCDKIFTGLAPYTQHLVSKVHAKQIEKKKLLRKIKFEELEQNQQTRKDFVKDLNALIIDEDILVCKLCSMSFSGPESALMHVKGKGHSKMMDKKIRKLEKKVKSLGVLDSSRDNESTSRDAVEAEVTSDDNITEELVSGKNSTSKTQEDHADNIPPVLAGSSNSSSSSDDEHEVKNKVTGEVKTETELPTSESGTEKLAAESCAKITPSSCDSENIDMASYFKKFDEDLEHLANDSKENILQVFGSYENYKKYKKLMNAAKSVEDV